MTWWSEGKGLFSLKGMLELDFRGFVWKKEHIDDTLSRDLPSGEDRCRPRMFHLDISSDQYETLTVSSILFKDSVEEIDIAGAVPHDNDSRSYTSLCDSEIPLEMLIDENYISLFRRYQDVRLQFNYQAKIDNTGLPEWKDEAQTQSKLESLTVRFLPSMCAAGPPWFDSFAFTIRLSSHITLYWWTALSVSDRHDRRPYCR